MGQQYYRSVAERILGLRRSAGLTQDELAERAGLSKHFISRVENGAENLSLQTLGRFSFALGVPVARFLEGVEVAADIVERKQRRNARDPALRREEG